MKATKVLKAAGKAAAESALTIVAASTIYAIENASTAVILGKAVYGRISDCVKRAIEEVREPETEEETELTEDETVDELIEDELEIEVF